MAIEEREVGLFDILPRTKRQVPLNGILKELATEDGLAAFRSGDFEIIPATPQKQNLPARKPRVKRLIRKT